MYEYIKGRLEYLYEDYLVIDVNGIGYKLFASKNTISSFKTGMEAKVFTHLQVKEDDMVLFGFHTREELGMFRLLISVSGVGPKAAISLLSQYRPQDIAASIMGKDISRLTKAPGIGKKIAERILLELKDKIDIESVMLDNTMPQPTDEISEVIEALVSLGYNYTIAANAVAKLKDTQKPIDSLIKDALRQLSM